MAGIQYSYTPASGILKPSRADIVHQIAYMDAPFLAMFMNPSPKGTKRDKAVKFTKHYWNEMPLKNARDKVHTALAASATTLYTSEEHTHYIANKSYITVDDEVMKVTAVGAYSSGKRALTVTRAQLSTSDVAHKAGANILIANHWSEGDTSNTDYLTNAGTEDYNYTEIFREDFKITGTAKAVETYTEETEIKKQILWALPQLIQQLETALARPSSRSDDGAGSRWMGGFPSFVTSSMTKDATGQAFNLNTFDEDIEELIDTGANRSDLVMACGGGVRRKLNEMKASVVRETMKIRQFNYNLDSIVTAHNRTVKIAPPSSRVIKPNEYYIFPMKSVQIKFLRAYEEKKLGCNGDADEHMLVMEPTAEFHNWQQGGALRRKNVY
ncbi:MAG: DUF5309 family protein [Patescibacteria group bacterium]|nr:DUF5309 family protein [Patescibacteria group bacterium]